MVLALVPIVTLLFFNDDSSLGAESDALRLSRTVTENDAALRLSRNVSMAEGEQTRLQKVPEVAIISCWEHPRIPFWPSAADWHVIPRACCANTRVKCCNTVLLYVRRKDEKP